MAYKLLSEPIRKYIREKRWDKLRPIQAAAIPKILETNNHYILASHTASGKTEAAFLPIISKVNFNEVGVQVLYISPLIALINDQFKRIEDLCKNLEIDVTKWHGEANRSLKKKLIKDPQGIVLITPESIEAMFVNAPYNVVTLFKNLKFIVIDEIHSFLGVDRGLQLMSLLFRLKERTNAQFAIIGLSATIGNENFLEIKKITGDVERTKVLVDKTKKITKAYFKYFENKGKEYGLDLLKDLYLETNHSKTLVFPNSRAKTEEIAVKLRRISDKVGGHKNYFSHHSSVDKEIRESVENFAKTNERFNFCISCTSTLELGIDIGTVDKVVQIDSTFSVSSLVQRIGRSGRKEGESSNVIIYTTTKWSFLQSLACWGLYEKDFLEPLRISEKAYDILLHQLLSIAKQNSGIKQAELINFIILNPVFKLIRQNEVEEIIEECLKLEYLEKIRDEIILGLEGEYIVNSKDFYSVFKTEENFKVSSQGRKIGEMPFSPQIEVGENILLAARIWKIKDVDFNSNKIEVIPANDGKPPTYSGTGGNIHPEIRKEMFRILKSNFSYPELNENCKSILEELRFEFKHFTINDFSRDVPIVLKENSILVYTFSGSKINKSIKFIFAILGYESLLDENNSSLDINSNLDDLKGIFTSNIKSKIDLDLAIKEALLENKTFLNFSKWGVYLPVFYQIEIIKDRYFDFDGAYSFLEKSRLVLQDI
ncbi:DEAD/DEAH box helicase [Leeuwenhoekiella sp. MAR_2009_132]|uniref:DEAD/DEAH box helicase n=1 Tax=Leeuwenhoekiella sp. MAR_2009_132 TaxID=1392489 RepID=UPI00048E609F|nr:DEAD/DEAH box helicase [Leeuwenhoekiella sp. MAR_2009_132]